MACLWRLCYSLGLGGVCHILPTPDKCPPSGTKMALISEQNNGLKSKSSARYSGIFGHASDAAGKRNAGGW